MQAYSVPRPPIPVDLYLHGNEGPAPSVDLYEELVAAGTDLLRAYPSTAELESVIAGRLGLDSSRIFVSAGADETIDRICRAMLSDEHTIVLPEPTFVMFRHYAALAEAHVASVAWEAGAYPTDAVIEAVDETTRVIAMVTPNNPTGAIATEADLRRVAEAAPQALVILDHAYVEFTDHDLTDVAMEYENVVVLRTLSKAFGMAGIRVGFGIAAPDVVTWLRRAGGPYSVPGPSIRLAVARLREDGGRLANFVGHVRRERRALEALLGGHGIATTTSEGNFVFGRTDQSEWLRDALAGMGILIRAFPGHSLLGDAVRISCPGDPADFERLEHALATILEPEALLFDLDGVLADVSESYRRSIVETARAFGVEVTHEDIAEMKAAGDANNDWIVTQRLLAERGVDVELDAVTETFEEIYQGTEDEPGLRRTETLLLDPDKLAEWGERLRIGIVTGRPRKDAERFLREKNIAKHVEALVCMEDAPAKPDPEPVEMLLDQLDVDRAWLVGDTPDDIEAARGARVLPIGVVAPGDGETNVAEAMTTAGAARVLDSLAEQLEELLS
jgi:histidinol-phosphate aminotransferase